MWKFLILNIIAFSTILVKTENITAIASCDRDGNSINNIAKLVLSVGSKTNIKCRFIFTTNDANTSNVTEESTNNTILSNKTIYSVLIYPKGLQETNRLLITNSSAIIVNHLIFDIWFNISEAGLKHKGIYLIYFYQNDLLLGANFSIEINALGNKNDKCQFVDQCLSSICANGLCVCDQQYPVYHDNECLHAKTISESCYINEQCQYGGHQELRCIAIDATNSNKTCVCQTNYIFVPNLLKCLLPKKINESCEVSEQCQSHDDKSFCSADHRCQCNKNGCANDKRENTFRYDILITVTVSVLLLVIIGIVAYKYYNNIKQFIIGLKKRRTTVTAQPQPQPQATAPPLPHRAHPTNGSLNSSSQPRQIERLVFMKKIANHNETNDEMNIYDDIAEIRYVTTK